MLLVRRIRRHAEERPDAIALIANGWEIGYRDLDRSIGATIRAIGRRGLAPGGVVVSYINDISRAWFANLALRSLGYNTLSVRQAADLESLGDMDVRALVTLEGEPPAEWPEAPARGAAHVRLVPEELLPGAEEPIPDRAAGSHIMLTSGTTGRWKMVRFDAVAEQVTDEGTRVALEAIATTDPRPARLLIFSFGLWTAAGYAIPTGLWLQGATVVVSQGDDRPAALDTPDLTGATATPAMLDWLMSAPEGAFHRHDDLTLNVISGALSESLLERIRARLTNTVITSMGGTEGGGWASSQVMTTDDLRWLRIDPAVGLEIVDDEDRPLPPGKAGRVRVRQSRAVTGYLNDPDATATFFRDGYFYPGDLAVTDGQGRVRILGRVSEALNCGGHKLPAGPIEEALQAALGFNCVCFSAPGAGNADELHVVVETAAPIDPQLIDDAARAHAQGFAAARFHFVAPLPRNDMGKVERYTLREMLAARGPAKA